MNTLSSGLATPWNSTWLGKAELVMLMTPAWVCMPTESQPNGEYKLYDPLVGNFRKCKLTHRDESWPAAAWSQERTWGLSRWLNVCIGFGGHHTIFAWSKLTDATAGGFHCVSSRADWLPGHLVSGGSHPIQISIQGTRSPRLFTYPLLLEVDTPTKGGKIHCPPAESNPLTPALRLLEKRSWPGTFLRASP